MTQRIPDSRIRSIIIAAIGPHSCIHEARENGVHLIAERDRAIRLAMPIAPKLAQTKFDKLPRGCRITFEDLQQQAYIGVIDGIDRYKPAMGVLVSTHVITWANNWMGDEIRKNHWSTLRPSKDATRRYFSPHMTAEERERHEKLFMSGVQADFNGDWNGVERTGIQV